MPHAPEPEHPEAVMDCHGAPFAIIGTDAAVGVLRGTGDPALDVRGQPGRVIYVDILDPVSGRTWFGATRNWTRKAGLWHWMLDLSLATDTADGDSGFDRAAGAFEITAYIEETDPDTGRTTTILAESFELTVAAPRTAAKSVAKTDSISVVLARIREIGEGRPSRPATARGRHGGSEFSMLPEDRFVFTG
jgi:hypothetical protein